MKLSPLREASLVIRPCFITEGLSLLEMDLCTYISSVFLSKYSQTVLRGHLWDKERLSYKTGDL
jgi:hypothetical protein